MEYTLWSVTSYSRCHRILVNLKFNKARIIGDLININVTSPYSCQLQQNTDIALSSECGSCFTTPGSMHHPYACNPLIYVFVVGLGGLGVTCSPRDPRFAGSNPTEVDGFFQDVKS